MKVLTYVKPGDVFYPNNENNYKKIETDHTKVKEEQTSLDFTIICICQSDPKKKLEQLIDKGKTNQEIDEFCKRFKIDPIDLMKSKWNVS